MQEGKKRLNVIHERKDPVDGNVVVEGTTCFEAHDSFGVNCQRQRCQHWISNPESHNCVMLAVRQGPHTLQKIGEIYGLSRMRICQIEKNIFKKIREIS